MQTRTVFTRFIPVHRPEQAHGAWRRYYERWAELTLDRADPGLYDLLPAFRPLVPPAIVTDKGTYSPWGEPGFERVIAGLGPTTLVITGAETDVCVLAAILGAVDRGFRVVVPTDGVCSSSDSTHDALLKLYQERYSLQIEAAKSEEILAAWR